MTESVRLLDPVAALDDRFEVVMYCNLPVDTVMQHALTMHVPDMFDRWLMVPAVTEGAIIRGVWGQIGAARYLPLDNNGGMLETLVALEPGRGFRCVLNDFKHSFERAAVTVDDAWLFEPQGQGTLIRWTWTFHAGSRRQQRVGAIERAIWRRYLRRILSRQIPVWEQQREQAAAGSPSGSAQ